MARGSRGASEEQAEGPGRSERPPRGGEEAETDVHRGAREAFIGGVLRRPAAAIGREDSRHCGEVGPEEECGPCVVLQPETEAEAHEVCSAALTGVGRGVASPSLHPNFCPLYITLDAHTGTTCGLDTQ